MSDSEFPFPVMAPEPSDPEFAGVQLAAVSDKAAEDDVYAEAEGQFDLMKNGKIRLTFGDRAFVFAKPKVKQLRIILESYNEAINELNRVANEEAEAAKEAGEQYVLTMGHALRVVQVSHDFWIQAFRNLGETQTYAEEFDENMPSYLATDAAIVLAIRHWQAVPLVRSPSTLKE